jgi:hypothetical protein
MPIKTSAQLITQSNNTFADSPPANITPTNHREWNVDAVDTMFSIGGRVITTAQMQDIIDNEELVAGTQYFVADYPFPWLNSGTNPLIVTAASGSSLCNLAFWVSDAYTRNLTTCWIAADLSSIALASWTGNGNNSYFNFSPYLTNLSQSDFFEGSEIMVQGNNASVMPYFIAQTNHFDPTQFYQQNVWGINPSSEKVMATITDPSQMFVCPNNGTADSWGIDGLGVAKSIQYYAVTNITDIWGYQDSNFVKVNGTIHGTLRGYADASFGTGDAIFDFLLPFPASSDIFITGHGHFSNAEGHIVLLYVYGMTGQNNRARVRMRLYGNHNDPITGDFFLTFAYS